MPRKKLVVIGLLGTTLDNGRGPARWERWRPTVALAQHEDLLIDRIDLIHGAGSTALAATVIGDIANASPSTKVVSHVITFDDAWDFELVYAKLYEFAKTYPFDTDTEEYLVHITTGTHVAQICLFALVEARYLPARLLQTSPRKEPRDRRGAGTYSIIDLDLSKYDAIAARFQREKVEAQSFLKAGIETKNAAFNELVARIERVAMTSAAPMLLTGPTGAGKSKLASRIFELKKTRRQVTGEFAEVNCATLRGDAAMSALFGHKRGAFTGATADRPGLLRKADKGVLFLDEIGELGLDEQAMLLRAIEEKRFYPLGSDREVSSDFHLIAGTNRDLRQRIAKGEFREDLLARINLWTFKLPSLSERSEDIEPNLEYELAEASSRLGFHVTMNKDARARFLSFAREWSWPGNFRDFDASIMRMATLCDGGRITERDVHDEIAHTRADNVLAGSAGRRSLSEASDHVAKLLGPERAAILDRFDRTQLEDVLSVCARSRSLAEAGRELFASSRGARTTTNDSDRLRKYLARFDLDAAAIRERLGH